MKNKSQLKRSLSPLNVWSLALGSIIGWGAFVMPGDLFLPTAGPLGGAIGMIIGALIMCIIAVNYGYMINKYPVAGGEFAFSFLSFGRKNAFVTGWFLGLSYLSIVPLNATALGLIGRYMFPGLLQRGYLYSIAGWDVYLGEILLSSVALIIFAWASIKGIKFSGVIQTILALSLVSAILIIAGVALFHPQTDFTHLQPAFSSENTTMSGILTVVAVAPWAFVGFDSIPQAAEEFNFPAKKALLLMLVSIIIGGLMYVAMNTITAIVYPWEEFIASGPFWATGAAVEELLGTFGLVLLGIALTASILSGIIGFYMATSRLLLSMARASALPEWFANIHPKHRTPNHSILFILIISLITPWFGRQVLLWVVDMASIGAAIGYFYTSISAFMEQRKDGSSALAKTFSLLGSVLSLGFIVLLIVPGMPAYLSLPSRIALFIWIGIGILFYVVSYKKYNKPSREELTNRILNISKEG